MSGPSRACPPSRNSGGLGILIHPANLACASASMVWTNMDTRELHRGRLIDHLQLVVRDLEKSKRFYSAVFGALGIPLGGEGPGFFWADEFFVSSVESPASAGALTGRAHFA